MPQQILSPAEVRALVARVNNALGLGLDTPAAERIVLGTGATESAFEHVRQIGNGPALGLWQMEPDTFHDIWKNWLAYRPLLAERVAALGPPDLRRDRHGAEALVDHHELAAAMCRVHYRRYVRPENLPEPEDIAGLAGLWKRRYNTTLGAGKVEHFMRSWERLCAPLYEPKEA